MVRITVAVALVILGMGIVVDLLRDAGAALFPWVVAIGCIAVGVGVLAWPALARGITRFGRFLSARGYGPASLIGAEASLELDFSVFRDADIFVAQFGGAFGGHVEHKTFERCRIIGPAVLSLHDCPIIDCEVSGDAQDMVWATPSDNPAGCVFMVGCRFYQCSFEYVGLAVPADDVPRLREELTPPTTPGRR